MAKKSLIEAYRETFGEEAPIFDYPPSVWPQMVLDAINTKTPMRPASDDIPADAMLSPQGRNNG